MNQMGDPAFTDPSALLWRSKFQVVPRLRNLPKGCAKLALGGDQLANELEALIPHFWIIWTGHKS